MKSTAQFKNTIQTTLDAACGPNHPWRFACFARLARSAQAELAMTRSGRIILHLLVALKTGHYLWHWHGIIREFVKV